jgi:uncharacterized protein
MSTPASSANAPLPGRPEPDSPYHAGEQAMQTRAGVRERAERMGRRMIRDFMPDQHRELFEKLPYIVAGSIDRGGRPWASILAGAPGFIRTPDERTIEIAARPLARDPLAANLALGAPLALLGIELETRRRNRANGTVIGTDASGFAVYVRQSFGNCPQYIQARTPAPRAAPANEAAPRAIRAETRLLSERAAALVRHADTFFIASASPGARGGNPSEGADVSHRGGKPGFVRVESQNGQTLLTAPDFPGNNAFNTFGNLAADPRAGLLFVDFAAGHTLSLTGGTEIVWDGPELAGFAGAQRLLKFRVEDGVWIENALPLRWSKPEPAPQLAATGTWTSTQNGPP